MYVCYILGKPKQEIEFTPIEEPAQVERVDISEQLGQLSGDLHDLTVQLQNETWVSALYLRV